MLRKKIIIGIIIVTITRRRSILIALFLSFLWFLFITIVVIYWIKFIILELNTLNIAVLKKPVAAEKETVRSSGTDVVKPAILPIVFGFNSKFSAIFLKTFIKTYFEIKTIKIEGYMPGWLLEEGTEFSCAISNEDIQNIKENEIHLYNVMPIKYSYMSLEDLYAIHDKFMIKEAENE